VAEVSLAVTRLLLIGAIVLTVAVVLAFVASIAVGVVLLVRFYAREAGTRSLQQPYLHLDEHGYGIAVVMPAEHGIAWTSGPPTASDRWVSVSHSADGVVATSWNGIRATLHPGTGRVLASTFTK